MLERTMRPASRHPAQTLWASLGSFLLSSARGRGRLRPGVECLQGRHQRAGRSGDLDVARSCDIADDGTVATQSHFRSTG
jgi:hypothetical protein